MKVKFGVSPQTYDWTPEITFYVFLAAGLSITHQLILSNAHRTVFHSRQTNITNNNSIPKCGIPYEELRCSVLQSTNNKILKHCLTDHFLMFSRILLLVLMVMCIYALRSLFTIYGKYSRFVVRVLWMVSAFIFLIIAYGVHYDSCFHYYTCIFLFSTGMVFSFIFGRYMAERRDRRRFLFKNTNINHESAEVDDQPVEEVDSESTEETGYESNEQIDDDDSIEEVNDQPIVPQDLL